MVTIGRRRNLCVSVYETSWCRRECKILRRESATNRRRKIQNPRPTRSGHAATPLPATRGRPPPILFRSLWPRIASRPAVPPCSPTSGACFSARFRKSTPTMKVRYPGKNLNVANSNSDEDPKTDRNSDANSHPDPDYTNSWDPSIREPNLKAEPLCLTSLLVSETAVRTQSRIIPPGRCDQTELSSTSRYRNDEE